MMLAMSTNKKIPMTRWMFESMCLNALGVATFVAPISFSRSDFFCPCRCLSSSENFIYRFVICFNVIPMSEQSCEKHATTTTVDDERRRTATVKHRKRRKKQRTICEKEWNSNDKNVDEAEKPNIENETRQKWPKGNKVAHRHTHINCWATDWFVVSADSLWPVWVCVCVRVHIQIENASFERLIINWRTIETTNFQCVAFDAGS